MKRFIKAFMLIGLFFVASSLTRPKPTRVVFFGDSITEAGAKPGGYITLIQDALQKKGQADQYELIGAGIGGNKIYDLYLRLEDDVLSRNPDIVFIWIGVNDVWHKSSYGTGTDADKFEKFYVAIIKKLQAKNSRVILCTPAAIGEKNDYTNQQDGDLNKYSQIIRNIATQYHCRLIDLRDVFHQFELRNNPANKDRGILTLDGVHLNAAGNQLVADQMTPLLSER